MAFPTVRSSSSNERLFDATSWGSTNLLPPTVEAGDLLLGWVVFDSTTSDPEFSFDSSTAGTWTELAYGFLSGECGWSLNAKVADGTEDGVQLTHTLVINQSLSWCYYAIRDWGGSIADDVDISAVATGTSATPQANAVTPGGGAADNLIISVYGANTSSTTTTVSTWSEPDNQLSHAGGAGDVSIGICSDEETTSPFTPGQWTISQAIFGWVAFAVSVAPAAAGTINTVTINTGQKITVTDGSPIQ